MDFSTPRKKQISEPTLPMINVVFLLLIFFLLSASIAPRAPFVVEPPQADLELESGYAPILFLSADGQLFFQGHSDEAALAAAAAAVPPGSPLTLRADASVSARTVAQLLADMRAAGISQVQLVNRPG